MGQRCSENFYNVNIKTLQDQPGCPIGWSLGRISSFFCNKKESKAPKYHCHAGWCLPPLSSEGALMKGTAFIQESLWPLWREGINWDSSDFERLLMSPQSHSHCVICQPDAERGWVTGLLKTLGTVKPQGPQRIDERKLGLHYERGALPGSLVLPAVGAEDREWLFTLGSHYLL